MDPSWSNNDPQHGQDGQYNQKRKRSLSPSPPSPSSTSKFHRTANSQDASQARKVADHYNARPDRGREARKESPIFRLKSFNNWIKSVLIGKYTHKDDRVLDLGCGKGGDLLKWVQAEISLYVGADIADVSIQQAEERYRTLRWGRGQRKFPAYFYAVDCYTTLLQTILEPKFGKNTTFDVVSMQFCLHYSFETERKARMMLRNVSSNLRSGGWFIGTIPDANLIVKKLKSLPPDEHEFGNDVYSIGFKRRDEFPKFGCEYMFHLTDAVDCPEWLVHWDTFRRLAEEYGLVQRLRKPFHELFEESARDYFFNELLYRMKVIPDHPDGAPMSAEMWEAARLYLAFAFQKT